MLEYELLKEVQARCDKLGLYHYHPTDSRRDRRGFPDLVIVGPRGVIFAELKSASGKLEPDQRRWGTMLSSAGEVWTIWRPGTLHSGIIQRMLESIS